ncbi:hypothetical protein [Planctellipticum variicoloris]|uniref:hypothetical protein n=1 Tax=Planctellipticum variicoloris TaxID=3064265 RepID=UPI003013A62A|nr:hypothetical protein SH412_005480 [Planctomycetaceae bacterium SH412]
MSPPTLREPWFLKHRTSIWQRAIVMSLVLGGLGFLAGLIWLMEMFVLLSLIELPDNARVFAFGVAGSLALGAGVAVPYLSWIGTRFGILRTRLNCLVGVAAILSAATAFTLDPTWIFNPPVVSHSGTTFFRIHIPVVILIQFPFIWLAWSAALLRRTWGWLIMSGLSAGSLLAIPATIYAIGAVLNQWSDQLSLQFQQIAVITVGGTSTSQFLALLVIPWGIPFWFPPAREPAPQ